MLPQNRRISREEFKSLSQSNVQFARQLQKPGRAIDSPILFLFVYSQPLNGMDVSKFSFSCSKKVSKKAVVRNKLRRRGYASIHKILATNTYNIPRGLFFTFVFKKGAEKSTYKEVENEVRGLIGRV